MIGLELRAQSLELRAWGLRAQGAGCGKPVNLLIYGIVRWGE